MSNYKIHIVFGVVLTALFYLLIINIKVIEFTSLFIYFPIIIFYSILPDVDHGSSIARKVVILTAILLEIGLLILFYFEKKPVYLMVIVVILVSLLFITFLRHRGVTHRFIFAVLLSLPLLFIGYVAAILGFIAYMSHLILDRF